MYIHIYIYIYTYIHVCTLHMTSAIVVCGPRVHPNCPCFDASLDSSNVGPKEGGSSNRYD